jgi:ABC-type branched-subunit amino acid transport system ATPase component
MLLELNAIHAFYGKIEAVKGVSLRVEDRSIVSLLGANGAGKTTVVRTIVGLHRSCDNDIQFDNRPIGNVPPHQIVSLGIAMVPERRELFPDMSVVDNLEMGATHGETQRRSAALSNGPTACFRSWPSGESSAPARSAAANSRCSQSDAA